MKECFPGDERTQQIILRNTSEKPTDFYMEVEVIKALEEASKASGAAYTFFFDGYAGRGK